MSTDGAFFALSNGSSEMTAIPGKEFELKFKLLDENDMKKPMTHTDVSVPNIENDQTNVTLDPTYSYIRGQDSKALW